MQRHAGLGSHASSWELASRASAVAHRPLATRSRAPRPATSAAASGRAVSEAAHHSVTPSTTPAPPGPLPSYPWILVSMQAVALVGAAVTGTLARRRRQQMEGLVEKLRAINGELMRQREEAAAAAAAGGEPSAAGGRGFRTALEKTLDSPSAAHPVEEYGGMRASLARAQRQIAEAVLGAKQRLAVTAADAGADFAPASLLPSLDAALQTAADIKDPRAQRTLLRLRARANRAAGNSASALADLQRSVAAGAAAGGPPAGDSETLGEMGDLLTEMGDLERAGECYDACFSLIQDPQEAPPPYLSGTWDP